MFICWKLFCFNFFQVIDYVTNMQVCCDINSLCYFWFVNLRCFTVIAKFEFRRECCWYSVGNTCTMY